MTKIMVGIDGMESPDRVRVLGIIDQFRELGINEDISLPQLVVVGDQSSGKSSLLEGLTGLSFPVASDLCTRHATQLVLRRSTEQEAAVKVSIIPGPTTNGNVDQKRALEGFARTLEGDKFSSEELKTILDEAAKVMGLPGPESDMENLGKRFSDDILKIELSGPEQHHLSIVDVPGLFHNPTRYQTEEDKVIIRGLIEHYITDSRTIILAVLDARNNLANQDVFRMARAADTNGARTVGIITKCDALQAGDEPGVLKIAQNSVERLNHGWFAVKNRSTQEIADGVGLEQRNVLEREFFCRALWNQLAKERVGIASLKKFLANLLYDHIRGEFPALVQEIRNSVTISRNELDALGPPRQTFMEQRQFVTRLAAQYQRIVNDSLSGNYDSSLDPQHPLKLRMHLQLANEDFGKRVERNGHAKTFRTVDGSVDMIFRRAKNDENIYDWIRNLYRQSRGAELPGTVNPAVLENLFRQLSVNWEVIGEKHVMAIKCIIDEFNKSIFERLIPEESMRAKVAIRNAGFASVAFVNAASQLEKILRDERGGILQTINHYFADTLAKTREERVLQRLKDLGLQDGMMQVINLAAIKSAAHLSNEDQAVNDIHDILKAYYKVAMKRFMDNVVLQVVERHFLGDDGPVKAITPEYVGTLSDVELADIAAEDYATSCTRTDVSYKLNRLEKALKLAEIQPI